MILPHPRRTATLVAIGVLVLWSLGGGLLVPALIQRAYDGDSWPVFNKLIGGQAQRSVDFYLHKWSCLFWPVLASLAALVVALATIPFAYVKPQALRSAWNGYWFRPTPLGYLAITRLVCVGTQLWILAHAAFARDFQRLRELSLLPDALYDPLPVLRALLWPWGADARPDLDTMVALHLGTMIAGGMALIGFRTNLSLLVFALGSTMLQAYQYSFGDLHHPEALLILTLWALAVSPAGQTLSVDDWLTRGGTPLRILYRARTVSSLYAAWPLLLVQCLLGVVYLDAALKKLCTAGLDWVNGFTLQYYLFNDGLRRGSELGVWLAHQHVLAWALSWITMLFEATFFLTLLCPRLAFVYVPVGLALHTGMCVTKVACFNEFMALYIVFLPHLLRHSTAFPLIAWHRHAATATDGAARAPNPPVRGDLIVLFDGSCCLCNGWVKFVIRRDPHARFRFASLQSSIGRRLLQEHGIDPAAIDSLVLLAPTGSSVKSAAILRIAHHLSGAWPALWMLAVIPVFIRDWGYDVVAGHRYRWFGHATACEALSSMNKDRLVHDRTP